MAQYELVITEVIPVLTRGPTEEQRALSHWSLEEAEARLFARLTEIESASSAPTLSDKIAPTRTFESLKDRAIWGGLPLWGRFAAALLLISALGLVAYRLGVNRGLDLASYTANPSSKLGPDMHGRVEIAKSKSTPALPERAADPQADVLRARLEESVATVGRLKAQQAESERELHLEKAEFNTVTQDRAALSQQLELTRVNLEELQQKLELATKQSSQDAARMAELEQAVVELNGSMHERDEEIVRERELLDHDRDIRELMGSRNLYVAEVYDVAKTGDTLKAFGRVFYTSGNSLVFYAYDLDQRPDIDRASTFQVWGRRGPDRDHAVNLGILFQDNANQKRWVLKSDNPKVLAQIDAVFVTIEPNRRSTRPTGKPLLFAYLRVDPNHP